MLLIAYNRISDTEAEEMNSTQGRADREVSKEELPGPFGSESCHSPYLFRLIMLCRFFLKNIQLY